MKILRKLKRLVCFVLDHRISLLVRSLSDNSITAKVKCLRCGKPFIRTGAMV
jgi:hypothetical protein